MSNIKKLTELGIKYQTDKAFYHSFTDFYNDYFEKLLDKPINILEIGIAGGASLLTLKEFFPKSTIYAIDINKNSVDLKLGDNIHTYLCSQVDFNLLYDILKDIKFDIIIEDGSHLTSHQQKTLGFLFPFLNKNGIYICEDLHTSFRKNYIDSNITTMDMINNYFINKVIESDLIPENNKNYLNDNIEDIILYERKENAIMCYNCRNYNLDKIDECKFCKTNLSPNERSITSIILHK